MDGLKYKSLFFNISQSENIFRSTYMIPICIQKFIQFLKFHNVEKQNEKNISLEKTLYIFTVNN